jgi:ABC-type bacteriocin/lantibiotic exporter with double-glycine peptidase domain
VCVLCVLCVCVVFFLYTLKLFFFFFVCVCVCVCVRVWFKAKNNQTLEKKIFTKVRTDYLTNFVWKI